MIPIAISDFSAVNALGRDRNGVRERLLAGESGLTRTAPPVVTELGRIEPLPVLPEELRTYDSRVARVAWLGLAPLAASIEAALRRWGSTRVAVVIGSSTGGVESSERAFAAYCRTGEMPSDYSFDNQVAFDALSRLVRQAFGVEGPAYVVSTACSSSSKAIAAAARLITTGLADAVITGGADSLCGITLHGFHGLGVLSPGRCQPFGAGRDGINLGEGAAFFLLERDASAACYLLGTGESSDAHHLSSPHPEGLGAKLAMTRALDAAGLRSEQVGYINAHGTGTELNDSTETAAIRALFEERVPVSSTKAATGHLLGASGATEAAVCLLALESSKLPANLLTTPVDPALDLDLVTTARVAPVRVALSNSFAFGGSNASLVFGRDPKATPSERSESAPTAARSTTQLVACATWPPLTATGELEAAASTPAAALLSPRVRGRASMVCRMFAEVIAHVQGSAKQSADLLPIVYGSAAGEMETTLALFEQLVEETSSPVRFQASVHNTASGLISIATHNQTFSTAIAAGSETVAMALLEATAWLRAHGGEVVLAVADEAAVSLLNGKAYPAFAAAFLLRQVDGAPAGAPGLGIGVPRRAHDGVGAEKVATVAGSAQSDNPCHPALELARRAQMRTYGTVPLTNGAGVHWVVDLRPS